MQTDNGTTFWKKRVCVWVIFNGELQNTQLRNKTEKSKLLFKARFSEISDRAISDSCTSVNDYFFSEVFERCMHCFKDFPFSELIHHTQNCSGDMSGPRERFQVFTPSVHYVSMRKKRIILIVLGLKLKISVFIIF